MVFLIGQIKLTRIHVAPLLSPGYGSNKQKSHLFTMSKDPATRRPKTAELPNLLSVCDDILRVGMGGADRDRTDDLKLAKLPLSQLSYGPVPSEGWWARVDSNYRPHAYQACALTT